MKLFFQKYGSGPPIIILHGLFGSGDNWRSIGRSLADQFSVYLVDLRNHGRSPWHPDHTYPAMAGDVLELLDRQGIERAHIVGHSMGGKTAMYLALRHPHRVEKLIVVDIAPKKYDAIFGDIIKWLRSLPLYKLKSRTNALAYLLQFLPQKGIVQFLLKNLVRDGENWRWRVNLDAIEAHLGELNDWPDVGNARFEGPTLFVRGKQSDYIQPEDYPRIRHYFPKARFVTIANAGHWVHADQPDVFVRTVRFFLNK